jgi:16S rRNA processing protein RimM
MRGRGPDMQEGRVIVGRVVTAHGIRGKVIVESLTENPGRFVSGSVLYIDSEGDEEGREVTVGDAYPYKGRMLLSLSGIDDRNAAEELRGKYLYVPFGDLPPPEEGEYYHHQLVGLRAVNDAGVSLGIVRGVVSLPAQDALVIDRDGVEHLVPFVDEFVRNVDLEREIIVITDMPGLFEGV